MTVNLSLFAGAAAQFFTDDGTPLAGGLVYSYAAGTTTPQTTYTTSAGNVANPNPIVLDAAGRVPNEIWLTAGQTYKFVVTDSTATLIGTYDNIPGANDYGDVGNTTTFPPGASLVGYKFGSNTAYSTGAVAQNVYKKLNLILSVKDFGAVGDGVADDTNAIKAAIAAAGTFVMAGNSGIYGNGVYAGTMPTVFFPSGTYKITSALTPDTGQAINYTHFLGESSMLVMSPGVVCFGGVGYNVRFEGLTFRNGAAGISCKTNNIDTTQIYIVGCEFNCQTDACIRTDSNSNSTLMVVDRCKFVNYQSIAGSNALIGKFLTGDQIVIQNSWISFGSKCCFYNGSNLQLRNVLGVPYEDANGADGRWVDNYGGFSATDTRFGGEGGGSSIIYNYYNGLATGQAYPFLTIGSVYIENCALFPKAYGAGGGVIHAFGGIPGSITVRDSFCPVDSVFIRDRQGGGTLKAQIAAFAAANDTALFQVTITGNTWRSTALTDDAALTAALLPYTNFMNFTSYPAKQVQYNLPNVIAQTLTVPNTISAKGYIGQNFPQTSVGTAGTSIVDTGIYKNTAQIGFGGAAVYDVYVTGDPNPGGGGAYRATQLGQIVIGTAYSGGTGVGSQIFYNAAYVPNFQDISELTVSATFWDGSSEASIISFGTNYQIRLKIAGYTSGQEGSNQTVYIVKRL